MYKSIVSAKIGHTSKNCLAESGLKRIALLAEKGCKSVHWFELLYKSSSEALSCSVGVCDVYVERPILTLVLKVPHP